MDNSVVLIKLITGNLIQFLAVLMSLIQCPLKEASEQTAGDVIHSAPSASQAWLPLEHLNPHPELVLIPPLPQQLFHHSCHPRSLQRVCSALFSKSFCVCFNLLSAAEPFL